MVMVQGAGGAAQAPAAPGGAGGAEKISGSVTSLQFFFPKKIGV